MPVVRKHRLLCHELGCYHVKKKERERPIPIRERENSNSKTLFSKDCSLGSFRERETDRQTETETETDRQTDRQTDRLCLIV